MSRTPIKKSLLPTLLSLVLSLGCAAVNVRAQTVSVVHNFGSQTNDPIQPYYSGIIAQGRDGNLYSSALGGANGLGAVYNVTPGGVLTTLYSFGTVSTDGVYPYSGLTLGADGNFYGTTNGGGLGSAPHGTVFKMTPAGGLTTLYAFTNGTDGALPFAPPVQGTDGNLYGTTCGDCNNQSGQSTIYKITSSGAFTALYQFAANIGNLEEPLVQGKDGNFYGTTEYTGGNGEVFKITPSGKLAVLYSFSWPSGAYPISPLVQAADGNFYGTTLDGGTSGYGVVFKITPGGKLTVLHNMNGATDGGNPSAGLVQATDGNLYGVNANHGASSTSCPNGCGTIFKITPKGVFSVLYNFDLTTGQLPIATLFQHTNGLLYGTTELGGTGNLNPKCTAGNCGVLYSVNIGATPFVSLLSTVGQVGNTVEILGQGFTGTTAVSFNKIAASFSFVSDTYLTATVPSGATTGSVTVTTPGGTLTSSKPFRVTPQISSFTPSSGPVGTSVTITGVSLTQTTRVTFGGVAATSFVVNSDTGVTATVPTGAKTGKIAITTPGGSATSTGTFTVTL